MVRANPQLSDRGIDQVGPNLPGGPGGPYGDSWSDAGAQGIDGAFSGQVGSDDAAAVGDDVRQREALVAGHIARAANGPGIFGPITDNSVRRFQADNGLTVDGIVGPQTAALQRQLSGGGASANDAGSVAAAPSPDRPSVHRPSQEPTTAADLRQERPTRAWIGGCAVQNQPGQRIRRCRSSLNQFGGLEPAIAPGRQHLLQHLRLGCDSSHGRRIRTGSTNRATRRCGRSERGRWTPTTPTAGSTGKRCGWLAPGQRLRRSGT